MTMMRLDVIEQVLTCEACDLHAQCGGPVAFSGDDPASIVLMGEAPGKTEDEGGEPFIGPAGQLLRRTLSTYGIGKFSIVNTVSCFPHGTPTAAHVKACGPVRNAQLALLQPDFVLLLGKVATKAIMPSLDMKHGRRRPFETNGTVFCSSYHPAAPLHDPGRMDDFVNDVSFFGQLVANGRADWARMIPDSCSSCPLDAVWFGANGLGWCEVHMSSLEREKYTAWMAMVTTDYEQAKARLEARGGGSHQALGDAEAAKVAREQGIAMADAGADPDWKEAAYKAVVWCAEQYNDFTADEVWARLKFEAPGETTQEPAALGPVFLRVAGDDIIIKTGQQRPTVNAQRHRDLTVWRAN